MAIKRDSGVVYVEIRASQIVHYKQLVIMTRKEWEEIKGAGGREMLDQHTSLIDGWIDKRDVHDGGDYESIKACVTDADGKPIASEESIEVS